jgi:phospholipase C
LRPITRTIVSGKLVVLFTILGWSTLSLTGCVGLVGVPVAPTVNSFTANPAAVMVGQSTSLTWTTTNANSATLDNGVGQVSPNGVASVSPAQTTVYTLTVQGPGGSTTSQITVTVKPATNVTITATPSTIFVGQSTVLTVTATNATKVVITDNVDANTYPLPGTGGTQSVSPTATVVYTATATDSKGQTFSATVTVTVNPAPTFQGSVNHIVFMMQENHTFDNYFGMLNPYRAANQWNVGDDGKTYNIDGIEDKLSSISNMDDEGQSFSLFKLKSTCIDDDSSAWVQSFGDVNRFDFLPSRPILMDGFVHVAENFAKDMSGAGAFTDTVGRRAMGYYDQDYLNYYYYMASQFALSDRWFSPVASESIPNRIATMTGGTTQGLVHDPGSNEDNLQVLLTIPTIFEELGASGSWKIYYSTTEDQCSAGNDGDCGVSTLAYPKFPATTFTYFKYSLNYLYVNPSKAPCAPPTQNSGPAVGDPNNNFCIDTNHIAPLPQYFTDLQNGTLPGFAWIEPGYSHNDEHPGSGQSILLGQAQVANIVNSFMTSSAYKDSIFFWSYDEGGGPYDHVPPVPGHTNDYTDGSLGITTDISSIAVNPDGFNPCVPPGGAPPTLHCDLHPGDPGVNPGDAPAIKGFAAQLGFRLPNMVISPFTRKHYVSHIPMDHTAIIRLVETRFLGVSVHLTARDNTQPDLMDFFDFSNMPWATPPNPPQPVGSGTCDAANMGP